MPAKQSVTCCNCGVPVCSVGLRWTAPWHGPPAPHLLRGAIAAAFPDNDLFHQHDASGRAIYRYPRVHYRWDTRWGEALLFGFGDGVEALGKLFMEDLELWLGDRRMTVAEARISFVEHRIRILPRLCRYKFRSPWLPLNQENHERYQTLDRTGRAAELDRIAVGNILSAMKGLGIRIEEQVYAAVWPRRQLWCTYKGGKLLGFLGTLVTNIDLPDGFALGKAVSHGYGWIQPWQEAAAEQ